VIRSTLFRNTLFSTIFYTFAFCAFQFATCLVIVMAAFWCHAFLAFPSIKHEKQQKQHAVFLMRGGKVPDPFPHV